MIVLHSVSKYVGKWKTGKLLLDDVTWVIPARSKVVVLGQKGSGKSTLLSLINGSTLPSKGWVERKGSIAFGRLMRGRTGLAVTPRQLATRLAKLYRCEPKEITNFVAHFADMKHLMDMKLIELPKDYRQRLTAALFYGIPFDFYLFDETILPRKGKFRERLHEAYKERTREGGVIYATANPKAALQFDGTAAILFGGKITLFDSVEDAVAVYSTLPPPKPDARFVPDRESVDAGEDEDSWL